MFSNYPDVVDVPTMAKMLSIGRNMAYMLVSTGAVKSVRIGKKIRIPTVFIKDYLLGQEVRSGEEETDSKCV